MTINYIGIIIIVIILAILVLGVTLIPYRLRTNRYIAQIRFAILLVTLGLLVKGVYLQIVRPYVLENVYDWGGKSVANPNMHDNPVIRFCYIGAGYLMLFVMTTFIRNIKGQSKPFILVFLLPFALLICLIFYNWSRRESSLPNREQIYENLGGYG